MANQNPFSLVRRLTSTILILLLVLLVIQIAGTLWGRYVVTQELYSSRPLQPPSYPSKCYGRKP